MTTTFADYEPEDAWDRNDSVETQIQNLCRRVELLTGLSPTRTPRHVGVILDEIIELVDDHLRERILSDRDHLRAQQILEDIPTIRAKL